VISEINKNPMAIQVNIFWFEERPMTKKTRPRSRKTGDIVRILNEDGFFIGVAFHANKISDG
jgi:hypothetical protein